VRAPLRTKSDDVLGSNHIKVWLFAVTTVSCVLYVATNTREFFVSARRKPVVRIDFHHSFRSSDSAVKPEESVHFPASSCVSFRSPGLSRLQLSTDLFSDWFGMSIATPEGGLDNKN